MDNAKNGVIYFSMGSNLRSKDWPVETKQKLLQMLGDLEQIVLWKIEENLTFVPKNVHISNWFPQSSILCTFNFNVLFLNFINFKNNFTDVVVVKDFSSLPTALSAMVSVPILHRITTRIVILRIQFFISVICC